MLRVIQESDIYIWKTIPLTECYMVLNTRKRNQYIGEAQNV